MTGIRAGHFFIIEESRIKNLLSSGHFYGY